MAKQRMIHTRFWADKWVRKLSIQERYLFMYLLTNEHTNIAGVYELPLDVFLFETGFEEKNLLQLIHRISPKAYYIDEWVILPNFVRHQNLNNPKIRNGVAISLRGIPVEIQQKLIGYGYPMDKLSHLNLNSNSNLNAPLSGQEEPESPEAEEVRRKRGALAVKFKVS